MTLKLAAPAAWRAAGVAALISLLGAAPALAGPPWISIEYPVNPYDASMRGAFLLVHAFHHGTPRQFPIEGTAEGIVNGERRSVKLEFTATSRAGVYALKQLWPAEGTWTLVIRASQAPNDAATAVVELAADGQIASVRVPTRREGGWTVPAAVSLGDIEAGLRTRAGLARRS
ncbi:MAG: hypothetical protein ACREL9_03450 [Gemmatimonadales bacterium]